MKNNAISNKKNIEKQSLIKQHEYFGKLKNDTKTKKILIEKKILND